MEMTKTVITPPLAQEWMSTANLRNRSLSRAAVSKYARDMREGKWRETHQNAIAFYSDGTLADGQHRLAAIVEARVPVQMFVALGLTRESGSMIDQGRARTVVDALRIGGLVPTSKHTGYSVAIVKLIRAAEVRENHVMSISEVAEKIEMLRSGIDFACTELAGVHGVGLKNATLRAAVACASYHVSPVVLARFCRVMVSGMPESLEDEGLIRLRNWLLIKGAAGGGSDRIDRYMTILRYINDYSRGVTFKKIRVAKSLVFETGAFTCD